MAQKIVRVGNLVSLIVFASIFCSSVKVDGGIIKDFFQKITNKNNKTEDLVKQSAPICGSGIFSTPDESSLSPEIIFITSRPARSTQTSSGGFRDENNYNRGNSSINREKAERRRNEQVNEVAEEFRFNVDNVTIEELERHGFNRDAPVTFLMHGFTSGYPLQAWISAIVEAYTIDRESSLNHAHDTQHSNNNNNNQNTNYNNDHQNTNHHGGHINDYGNQYDRESRRINQNREPGQAYGSGGSGKRSNHNLFIINWNYAARGIIYPRAVANIPIVASYATRFINNKLLGEAQVDPHRIQLIGHSLGAHLAGFIGKNTRSKLGRIYGLDPAGPCFGAFAGSLYPSSKRLAPNDAEEVITIHTNTNLLGINKPLGKYSVFVEGGAMQPGCKGGGVLKSLSTLTWDGGDFDSLACSHSRAPNLLTYRHDQSDSQDDCQLVAYECKDWNSFSEGHCGICRSPSQDFSDNNYQEDSQRDPQNPLQAGDCLRIGLDWQYPTKQSSGNSGNRPISNEGVWQRPTTSSSNNGYPNNGQSQYDNNNQYGRGTSTKRPPFNSGSYSTTSSYQGDREDQYGRETYNNSSQYYGRTSTRRPYNNGGQYTSSSGQREDQYDRETTNQGYNNNNMRTTSRRPNYSGQSETYSRERSDSKNSSQEEISERRESEDSVNAKSLYLKTGDTQPYCSYHYQVVLELNEPFAGKKPPMSLLLQDSETENSSRRSNSGSFSPSSTNRGREQNSLANDNFGNKFNDKFYTHLLTSSKKLDKVDHATLLFREGLPDGMRTLKALHVNYMSHSDPKVRERASARLCLTKLDVGNEKEFSTDKRFYFKPCNSRPSSSSSSSTPQYDSESSLRRLPSTSNDNTNLRLKTFEYNERDD